MIKRILVSFILVASLVFISASYDLGNPRNPSAQEKEAFESLYQSVKQHQSLHPHSLEEAMKSLDNSWEKKINCPPGSKFNQVKFNISTRQVAWDPALTIKGRPSGVGPRDIGWYQWTYKSAGADGIKTVDAENYIMLDPAVILNTADQSPFKKTSDEALLYHELLHGQLVMDSIKNSPHFQKKVCNCHFDLAAGDFEHKYIPAYEIDYVDSLLKVSEVPSAYVIRPQASESSTPSFKELVTDASILTESENVRINWYLPRGNNLLNGKVDVMVEDEQIYVTGTLENPKKNGLLVVIIEPK